MKKLLIYLKKYKINLIVGPILKLLEAIIEVLLPIIIAFFIDNYNHEMYEDGKQLKDMIYLKIEF